MVRTQKQVKKDIQTFDEIIVSLKKQLKYVELSRYEMTKQLTIPVVIVPKGTCCLNPNIKGMANDMYESWSECTNCKKETV